MKKTIKTLTKGLLKKAGRNATGHITVAHQGGGHKRKYRFIDFYRLIPGECLVKRIEYDPNRTAFIALIYHRQGFLSYIISPENLVENTRIYNNAEISAQNIISKYLIGNCLLLKNIPLGTIIHNIELSPLKGGQLIRAAGTSALLLKDYNDKYMLVKLRSGEHRLINKNSKATIGIVSNIKNNQINLRKAGTSRLLNIRPTVRGIAKNPVDHPHGGRSNGGMVWKTPWGKLTKNVKTRNNNFTSKYIIIKRK